MLACGLFGTRVTDDVRAGARRSRAYQCAKAEMAGNPNWFAVADFIARLRENGQIPP